MFDRLRELEQLVALLRGPEGCPWDREQELSSLRAYLLEEAHEVAAAIDASSDDDLASELGDLLFQIVFAVKVRQEAGAFDMSDVVQKVQRKMIDRHPHVFGDESLQDSSAVRQAWERRKIGRQNRSVLAGVPESLPTLLAAYRMTQKAAAVGFDWPEVGSIIEKISEELDEIRVELSPTDVAPDSEAVGEEIGDLLFTVANLARRLEIDPEAALASANKKFKRRFQAVETSLAADGGRLGETPLARLDELWEAVKKKERLRSPER